MLLCQSANTISEVVTQLSSLDFCTSPHHWLFPQRWVGYFSDKSKNWTKQWISWAPELESPDKKRDELLLKKNWQVVKNTHWKRYEWKRWEAVILSSPNSTNQLLTLLEAILTLANLLIGTNHHLSPFKLISSAHTFIKIRGQIYRSTRTSTFDTCQRAPMSLRRANAIILFNLALTYFLNCRIGTICCKTEQNFLSETFFQSSPLFDLWNCPSVFSNSLAWMKRMSWMMKINIRGVLEREKT